MVYLIIFYYLPIWGWLMAFQDYKPGMGIKGSEWVGLKHFEILFGNKEFLQIIRNTICINLLKLIFSTFAAIMLALLLNEARNMRIKRSVQTISYLPHFISWIVIANLVSMSLSTDGGIINIALVNLGLVKSPVLWLGKPEYFWMILALTETWKEMGWSAIIYIAAMTSISPEIYEAANIDGASRIQKIMKITLPSIAPTIAIMLVLSSGWMMTAGFEQVLLMKNPLVIDVAEILPTYILKYGYNMGNFSFATAAGIFQSVVSLIILTIVNVLAKKYNSNYSII
jgi:putative aldouronate transport system permease protein